MNNAKYIELDAGPRYWEDATLNGQSDVEGKIPFREGERWRPVIELSTGQVLGWPAGFEASIHYKVCDDGVYWLLNEDRQRIAKWKDYYVPDAVLCTKRDGYGDYIIFKIGPDGKIEGWRPCIDEDKWDVLV